MLAGISQYVAPLLRQHGLGAHMYFAQLCHQKLVAHAVGHWHQVNHGSVRGQLHPQPVKDILRCDGDALCCRDMAAAQSSALPGASLRLKNWLRALQGCGNSSSMDPSGTNSTLSMPPFSTGLQIPDQGLAFSGLLGSQQTFAQNGGGGSLMPGSSGGLRMGAAFGSAQSMSMLMSSGGLVHSRVRCRLRAQKDVQQ